MDNGNQSIIITFDSVHLALDNLLRVSSDESPNPLHFLLLVELYLVANPQLPHTIQGRTSGLNSLLVSLIIDQYAHHRRMLGLPSIDAHATQGETLTILAEEGCLAKVELLSWSWLYHHYVRVDLGIIYEQFCAAAHVDKRTLRRYQQHGVKRLTKHVIQQEGEARQEQRKRWLYTHLPGVAFTPLIGRESVLKKAETTLQSSEPHHLQITGARGIGKTALVGHLVKRHIDNNLTDRVIWIHQPISVEFARHYLHEQLVPEESSVSLRETTFLQHIMVVLDGVEQLDSDLDDLLSELIGACVIITSSIFRTLLHSNHIALLELSKDDLFLLLDTVSEGNTKLAHNNNQAIWERAGGNPMAALMMFRHWPFSKKRSLSLEEIVGQVYLDLPPDLRRVWLIFALLPPHPQKLQTVIELWKVNSAHLDYLIQYHLLEVGDEEQQPQCALTTISRHFIETLYQKDAETRQLFSELVMGLQIQNQHDVSLVLDLVEHVLTSSWLQIDEKLREDWVLNYSDEAVRQGRCSVWRVILEPFTKNDKPNSVKLHIVYGVCLRRISEWKQAERTFELAVRHAGRTGLFLEQAKALLEWAILLHHQGKYEMALKLLGQVERVLSRQRDGDLLNRLWLEQAQIALDLGAVDRVLQILGGLRETPELLMIWGEALSLKQDYRSLELLIERAEPLFQDKPRYLSRVYSLLGQSYQQRNDWLKAYDYFCAALILVEQQTDFFAIARIRSNLGAVLIEQGAYREARLLLEQAEGMQSRLADSVGLAATRHNMQLLDRKGCPLTQR